MFENRLAVVAFLLLASLPANAAPQAVAIDGDTIRLGDEVIRLEGIDAPEMRQPCLDAAGKEYRCGRAAQQALAKLLTGPVECKPTGKDRYGRTLAYCSVAGVDLSRRMVTDGWAWAFVKYSPAFVGEEAKARAAHVGIWAGKSDPPWDWRAAQISASDTGAPGDCKIKGNINRKGERIYFLPFHNLPAH